MPLKMTDPPRLANATCGSVRLSVVGRVLLLLFKRTLAKDPQYQNPILRRIPIVIVN